MGTTQTNCTTIYLLFRSTSEYDEQDMMGTAG